MESLNELATVAAAQTESLDFHLFVMAGLVLLTAIGATVCISLLLLLAPVLHFALGRLAPRRPDRRAQSKENPD